MHHYSPEQLRALISHIPENRRLMILVGFWHGLRVSEIISLTARDIQHGYVRVERLKGSSSTLQPWVLHRKPDGTESELSEHAGLKELAKLPLDTKLFPMTRFGVDKILRRAGVRVGLPRSHAHMLKHTCARTMLKGGKTLPEVQTYLGHKSGNSTLAYLRVTEEEAAAGMGGLI